MLVSKPMFMWTRNPMITLKNLYNSWLTLNSKWLPSKCPPAKSRFPLRRKRSRKRPRNKTNTASTRLLRFTWKLFQRAFLLLYLTICASILIFHVFTNAKWSHFSWCLQKIAHVLHLRAETPILYRSFFPRADISRNMEYASMSPGSM